MHRRLAAEEEVQAGLTDDMLALAGQLRGNAEAVSSALASRDRTLDTAAQGLLQSVDAVRARGADVRRSVRRSRRGMLFSLFVLLAVAGTFLGARLISRASLL